MARALGGATGIIQATLGAGTARAAAAQCGTRARAEDADQVAGAAATVAVDTAAIRATCAAIALRYAPWRWLCGRLPRFLLLFPGLLLLAFRRSVVCARTLGQPEDQSQRCHNACSDTSPWERIPERTHQPVELPVIHGKASRLASPLTRISSWFTGAQSCQRTGKFASSVLPGQATHGWKMQNARCRGVMERSVWCLVRHCGSQAHEKRSLTRGLPGPPGVGRDRFHEPGAVLASNCQ